MSDREIAEQAVGVRKRGSGGFEKRGWRQQRTTHSLIGREADSDGTLDGPAED